MKEGPDIAGIAALIGDPARANILSALMNGAAYTATELAAEAGVTAQTASTHLGKLMAGGLIQQRKQGRHRYFSLADAEVASVLEGIMGLAISKGHIRSRTGPKDPALRTARVCYDHLAGDLAVDMLDNFKRQNWVTESSETLLLSDAGRAFLGSVGVDVMGLKPTRRPLCKPCLDWSVRRSHLAGVLGMEVLNWVYAKGWAKRIAGTRIVQFSAPGEQAFLSTFCR